MACVAGGNPSIDDFGVWLACQWQLHAPLEVALWPWFADDHSGGGWCGARLVKSAWLAADLAALGVRRPDQVADVPVLDSIAAAFGALYVLEGSSLGLRVIEQRCPAGHPAHSVANRFIRGYGADHGAYWRAFLDRLEALPEASWPEAAGGATATFAAFQAVFAGARRSSRALSRSAAGSP